MSKLKIEDVLKNINNICNERKIKFNGFCTKNGEDIEWHGNRTYLRLECLVCGYQWFSTDYEHLIHRGYGCKACKNAEHKMSEDEYMAKILDRCKARNYTFLYFCDKDGNKCEWIDARLTCLMLRCNICGNIWRAYYGNFIYFNNGCLKCAGIKFNKEYKLSE